MFVTQVPTAEFQHVAAAFGAIQTDPLRTPRGGDLWIRYSNGSLRNLTAEAGYGIQTAGQDGPAIAVRQPVIHWSGQKALVSMLIGAPDKQYRTDKFYWQLYEVTGYMPGEAVHITRLPCQPAGFNNIAPVYTSDDQVIFVSDRPRSGAAHLYPQLDEYESVPVESGLWKLDPAACSFRIIEHAPSGVSYPSIDSAGRVIFTKWDHLLRDQQADQDVFKNASYYSFNFDSEDQVQPPAVHSRAEVYPELRRQEYSLLPGQGYDGVSVANDYPFNSLNFNHFLPWEMNQDGSDEETLNHSGRHELGGSYAMGSYRSDPAQEQIKYGQFSGATYLLFGSGGMFHLREDPARPGRFWGVSSAEFATATGGDLVYVDATPPLNADSMKVELVLDNNPAGHFRNPLPLANGQLLVVHTGTYAEQKNSGTTANPVYNFSYRLRYVDFSGTTPALGPLLTSGLMRTVSYWSPDVRVTWSGALWELDPVEVRPRQVPTKTRAPSLPLPERSVLESVNVEQELLRNWLAQNDLALVVSRNVTSRDRSDKQQPYNLRVSGSGLQTIGAPGAKIYDVSHVQFFQADQVRGYGSGGLPQNGAPVKPGRRVLPRTLHDPTAVLAMGNRLNSLGETPIAPDGSMAAFVPAGRALTWQLVNSSRTGWDRAVVRERNWVSFNRGETRVCTSCHGSNTKDQAGNSPPTNPPEALRNLIAEWRQRMRSQCPEAGGTGIWSYAGVPFGPWEDGRRTRIQTCQGGNGCCDGLPKTETQSVRYLPDCNWGLESIPKVAPIGANSRVRGSPGPLLSPWLRAHRRPFLGRSVTR
ncbi:HzsA-related protein [Agrilutibacter solisilvae]